MASFLFLLLVGLHFFRVEVLPLHEVTESPEGIDTESEGSE